MIPEGRAAELVQYGEEHLVDKGSVPLEDMVRLAIDSFLGRMHHVDSMSFKEWMDAWQAEERRSRLR